MSLVPSALAAGSSGFTEPLRLIFWPSLNLMRWLLIALLVSLAALLIAAEHGFGILFLERASGFFRPDFIGSMIP